MAADGDQELPVNQWDVPELGSRDYNQTELFTRKSGRGSSASANLKGHDIAVFKIISS